MAWRRIRELEWFGAFARNNPDTRRTIMRARVLAVTMVAVLSLCVSPVFGQCCGSVATYMPAAPAYTTYYAPTTAYYDSAPYVAYYAPPAAYTTYYASPYVSYYASPYTTYYGPTVAAYPAYYARPGWSVFGAPRVYVPGQPVRNALRAVTP
jgi:hypothetical protein